MLLSDGRMEINVSQQLKATIGTVREYEIDDQFDIIGVGNKNSIKGIVTLTRTNRGILVQGSLTTAVPVECSRCLNTYQCPLKIDLLEEYFPVIDVNSGILIDLPEDNESFKIDEHHILDLREAIRQNALLAIPMKPLCRDDCPGICSHCGKDLTTGKCNCDSRDIDPRWMKLVKSASADKNIKNIKP
jgi:uncharacterized protein